MERKKQQEGNIEDMKEKTEIIIKVHSARTLEKLKEVIAYIKEMEKEHNCHCTLLEVEIFVERLMKK